MTKFELYALLDECDVIFKKALISDVILPEERPWSFCNGYFHPGTNSTYQVQVLKDGSLGSWFRNATPKELNDLDSIVFFGPWQRAND